MARNNTSQRAATKAISERRSRAMRELARGRRKARAKRGGLTAKDVIFDRWLKNPLLNPAEVAVEFHDEVKPNTVPRWLNSWLKGTADPGLPASARGREKEILAAQKKAREHGIYNYRLQTTTDAKTAPLSPAPEAVHLPLPPSEQYLRATHGSTINYFFYNSDARAIREEPRPRFRVLIEQGFAAAGGARRYGERFKQLAPNDILLMYENRLGVVALGRVKEQWDGMSHKVPKYYTIKEMDYLDGGPTEYRIAVEWFRDLSDAPIGIEEIKKRLGNTPRGVVRRIVEKREEVASMVEEMRGLQFFPEEIIEPRLYVEGAIRQVSVNAYERNRDAVRQCKESQGTACIICGFDFGSAYGPEFDGFIHVHHLRPLSDIGREYVVDPIDDLCPVCPNCHAVIHYGGKLRNIEEVRELLHQHAK